MNERNILDAVLALHGQFPELSTDHLQPDPRFPRPTTFEQFLNDALKNKEQVVKCLEWLELCRKVKTWSQSDTYTFKHECEQWAGFWISHTSILVAAKIRGLELKHDKQRPWASPLRIGKTRPGQP